MNLTPFLELASRDHKHLCPKQILGVRIGIKGMDVLGVDASVAHKALLVIFETDGCFIDGIIAVTKCTVGHRTLRIEATLNVFAAASLTDAFTEINEYGAAILLSENLEGITQTMPMAIYPGS